MQNNILIVGAGFAGAVYARQLAEKDYHVTVIDKRNHIAGNCYDYVDNSGIRIHKYGPHLFHTSNIKVFDYLSRFTKWIKNNPYYITTPYNIYLERNNHQKNHSNLTARKEFDL